MSINKSSLFTAVGIALVLGAVSIAANMRTAMAGDGCCADKAKASATATATPVAMNADGTAKQCPLAKAAADRAECQMADKASMNAACNMKGASKDMQSACASFRAANAAVAKAVENGANESELRALAVRAGGAYAEFIRMSAASYRANGKSNVSYASYTADAAACTTGTACCTGSDKGKKSDDGKEDKGNVRKAESSASLN